MQKHYLKYFFCFFLFFVAALSPLQAAKRCQIHLHKLPVITKHINATVSDNVILSAVEVDNDEESFLISPNIDVIELSRVKNQLDYLFNSTFKQLFLQEQRVLFIKRCVFRL